MGYWGILPRDGDGPHDLLWECDQLIGRELVALFNKRGAPWKKYERLGLVQILSRAHGIPQIVLAKCLEIIDDKSVCDEEQCNDKLTNKALQKMKAIIVSALNDQSEAPNGVWSRNKKAKRRKPLWLIHCPELYDLKTRRK